MKKILLTLCLMVLMASPAMAVDGLEVESWQSVEMHEAWIRVPEFMTFKWTPEPGATGYEVRLFNLEKNRTFNLGRVSSPPLTKPSTRLMAGHNLLQVRSIDANGVAGEWSTSADPSKAVVGGEPRAWWIYVYQGTPVQLP